MLFDPVTTNGAAILTMIGMWMVLTWMATYAFLSRRHQEQIDDLHWYIHEANMRCNDAEG
jgi:hypothetical protein